MPDKIAEEKRALLRATGPRSSSARAVAGVARELLLGLQSARGGNPGLQAGSVLEPGQPPGALRDDRSELSEQTGGEIDAIVFSVGTGGTISGTARYLRERKPDLLVVGADPEGSIFSQPTTSPVPRRRIGEDFWPSTFDPELLDEYVTVSDGDSFRTARRLAREEGLLVGGSGGTAVWAMLQVARRFGPEATLVTLIPDSGRGYLSKLYDDNWLMEHGFLEREAPAPTIEEVLAFKRRHEPDVPELITVQSHQKVGEAVDLMQRYGISQIPVVRRDEVDARRPRRLDPRARALRARLPQPGVPRRRTSPPRWSRPFPPSRSTSPWTPSSPISPPATGGHRRQGGKAGRSSAAPTSSNTSPTAAPPAARHSAPRTSPCLAPGRVRRGPPVARVRRRLS